MEGIEQLSGAKLAFFFHCLGVSGESNPELLAKNKALKEASPHAAVILAACERSLRRCGVSGESYDRRICKCERWINEYLSAEYDLDRANDDYREDHQFYVDVFKPAQRRFIKAKEKVCKYGALRTIPDH